MSLGGKKDKGIYWLIECFIIGLILLIAGGLAILDSSGSPIVRIFDWGRYQILIGVILMVIGAYYIFRAIKGYD